jgi:prevent-host-death family protein
LRIVKGGKEVVISERGRPVAKILPYAEELTFKQYIESLQNSGQIIAASAPKKFTAKKKHKRPGALKRFLTDRE